MQNNTMNHDPLNTDNTMEQSATPADHSAPAPAKRKAKKMFFGTNSRMLTAPAKSLPEHWVELKSWRVERLLQSSIIRICVLSFLLRK